MKNNNLIGLALLFGIAGLVILGAIFFGGCASPGPIDSTTSFDLIETPAERASRHARYEEASNEGLVRDEDGEIVHGITTRAMCVRFQRAFEDRVVELDCTDMIGFPSVCAETVGELDDCLVEQIEEWTDDWSWATSCEQLEAYVMNPETYEGFVCGDSCITTGTGRAECCEGTPYQLRDFRRCPYWCYGLSQCNHDAECTAFYNANAR